ncbi:ABC transporter permease/substrate-binding protein [Polynucleobacter antarcticus]|uniref:ABC transporter permease n=1 Tax=Polynucleobacter antarcticus TaxID=1743162 RepID=A0A6M9Q2D3_9BURK|nr:glycine betaine ABC transporter substrate-binding protein [Polynucleobacter antarcticus]QKM62453.1 ABC transporter permease [Polynucleobacter antarcticus]
MSEQIDLAWSLLPLYLTQHILLSASAMLLALAIALPLIIICTQFSGWRRFLLGAASVIQTIPGLALLALFYPILLGLSHLTNALFSVTFPALGFLPSLLALALYALLPILRNGVTGLLGVDTLVSEAADGVGMTARQKLLQIELPLAAPVLMSGIRIATVWTIGTATLATSVGQVSLGNYIFSGLQTENWVSVAFGCLAATALALAADFALSLIEAGLALRNRKKIGFGLLILISGVIFALTPALFESKKDYVVGAKNFSEQFILAQLIENRLESLGASVKQRESLGSAVAFRALANDEIDVYVDYSGTLWSNVLGRTDNPPRESLLINLKQELRSQYGITLLGTLGFENAYVLAMKDAQAQKMGIVSTTDLSAKSQNLRLGSDLEFLNRPEWKKLKNSYGLLFQSEKSFTPTFMYRALESNEVDVISAFSSDGRIKAQNLRVLTDPLNAAPTYDALILIAPKRVNDEFLRRALLPMVSAIDVRQMQEANYMVDRDVNKSTVNKAAQFLENQIPVIKK